MRPHPLLRVAALSLLLVLALPTLAAADATDLRRKISVVGQSSTLVANDAARVTLGVRATRPTAKAALQAASRRMQAVVGASRAAGVAQADIRTEAIGVSRLVTRLKGRRTKFRGYRATQSVSTVLRDVAATGALVDRAVAAGATRSSAPILRRECRALLSRGPRPGFDDASARAQVLAERAGGTLGPVLSVQEGSGAEPVTSASAQGGVSADQAAPATPTQPGQSSLDVTVSVVLELV